MPRRSRLAPDLLRLAVALSLLVASAGLPALAQTPNVPQGSPIPRILPTPPPAVAPGAITPPAAPSGEVPNQPVNVTSVAVEGVTAYPADEIARLAAGLVGPAVPLPRIDAARQAILQRYRSDGYVLTTVSAKLDAQGHLRLIVVEGRIASVKLDGDIGPAGTQVLRFLKRLTEQQPIDAATLERYLLLAQDIPGITLHAVLEPSSDEPGALNLIAQVSRTKLSGLATLDNRAFNETGPFEALGVIDINSFSEFGERTEFSYYHTFPNSENFGQVSSEAFVGSSGLRVRVYAGHGTTDPTGVLAASFYHGITTVLGGQATYPVIRSRQQTLNVALAFDVLQSTINANGEFPQSFDALRVLRLGEEYALSDLWLGDDRSAVDAVAFRISQGLKLLGASTNGTSPTSPRVGEQAGFSKLNFEVSRTQTLFSPWQGASVAVMGLATGQWTPNVLPPAEQFYLGGSRFTRGYYAGQVPGDKALAATMELQLSTSFEVNALGFAGDVATQFYTFYDWGETWQNLSTDRATMINSAGGGVRVQVTPKIEVDFEGLARFNRFPTGSGSQVSALNGAAFYFRLLSRF